MNRGWILDKLERVGVRCEWIDKLVRGSAALAGPGEGDAMKRKTHALYKAVRSALDALFHPVS